MILPQFTTIKMIEIVVNDRNLVGIVVAARQWPCGGEEPPGRPPVRHLNFRRVRVALPARSRP